MRKLKGLMHVFANYHNYTAAANFMFMSIGILECPTPTKRGSISGNNPYSNNNNDRNGNDISNKLK